MSASKQEINQALVDVRTAYRLLHDYQQAAMDAANYIGKQLGYYYTGGYGRFSNMLKAGKGSLDDWAWDTLNMMLFEFNFSPEVEGKNDIHFLIWLASDTGYFESDNPAVIQTDTKTFKAAEFSGTKLAFLFYRDWKAEFDPVYDHGTRGREQLRRFFSEGILPNHFDRSEVFGKCYDFVQVANEQATDALIDDLIQSAKAKRFILGRVDKTV